MINGESMKRSRNMKILKNWSVGYKGTNLEKVYLSGKVYGHPNFEMGASINTSSIQKIIEDRDFIAAETGSGSQYLIFKDDVSPEFLKNNPDFFERMMEHVNVLQTQF